MKNEQEQTLLNVEVFNKQKKLKISSSQVIQIAKAVIALEKQNCHEVSIHFVNKLKISELHAAYFNDPSPTDCISFPMDDSEDEYIRVLGEIFVCPEVAMEYSASHHQDPYAETTLYIVHGLLHLMGYDDIDENDRKIMRKAEKRHIRNLKKLGFVLHLN